MQHKMEESVLLRFRFVLQILFYSLLVNGIIVASCSSSDIYCRPNEDEITNPISGQHLRALPFHVIINRICIICLLIYILNHLLYIYHKNIVLNLSSFSCPIVIAPTSVKSNKKFNGTKNKCHRNSCSCFRMDLTESQFHVNKYEIVFLLSITSLTLIDYLLIDSNT